jgi:hypothetical protein
MLMCIIFIKKIQTGNCKSDSKKFFESISDLDLLKRKITPNGGDLVNSKIREFYCSK